MINKIYFALFCNVFEQISFLSGNGLTTTELTKLAKIPKPELPKIIELPKTKLSSKQISTQMPPTTFESEINTKNTIVNMNTSVNEIANQMEQIIPYLSSNVSTTFEFLNIVNDLIDFDDDKWVNHSDAAQK